MKTDNVFAWLTSKTSSVKCILAVNIMYTGDGKDGQ